MPKASERVAQYIMGESVEGFASDPYLDTLANPPRWTVGFGHSGSDARSYANLTRSQAEEILWRDLSEVEVEVIRLFGDKLTQGQFDALVDFGYNVGFTKAPTLVNLVKYGQMQQAAAMLLEYNHAGGRVLPGLTARREQEKKWFEEVDAKGGDSAA